MDTGKRKFSRQTPEFEESLTNSSNDSQGYNKKQKMLSNPIEIAMEAKTCSAEDDRSSIKIADADIIEIKKDDFAAMSQRSSNAPYSFFDGDGSIDTNKLVAYTALEYDML
ncbi:hypothetical protein AgCh_003861 [Apium graveolens]